jgi:transcriptional antiterminator NusG
MNDLARIEGSPANDGARWFAVWTQNQCEPKVAALLERKRIEVFLPRVRQPSRRRDRRVLLDRPLFPGYVFPRFAPSREAYLSVVTTDGVARILGDRWDQLHAIPDEQVEAVRRLVVTDASVWPVPWIRIGDRVRITAGALADLEGYVQDWRAGRARFVVSIDLLQRSVAVEVPSELLERV